MQVESLDIHLKNRPGELRKAKQDGVKIIGYFPGSYVPEEIIYASGAIPVCLVDGGNSSPAEAALSVVPSVICPFARTQLGEMAAKTNPYYAMVDMFVAPITCQHLRKVSEIWEYSGDPEIFKLGIPHRYDGDFELEYYTDRLRALADKLQTFTGNKITGEKINDAIELYNRIRGLLRKISLMRRADNPPVSSQEFIKLNHASFYADPAFMADVLDSVYRELAEKQETSGNDALRLLLLGPNVSNGDYKVLELVEETGARIVIEDIYEGIRYYWQDIENKGDSFQSLAKGYLADRLPAASNI
jgi:benzoyl-CoA reductase/2-hydroxyglutaryl-CoA dehydratase subunit BcrC/BadD/HgdB